MCSYSEKAMAPHSSTLAWKIPWTEEPGRLQFMGPLRVRHDWATSLSLFTFMHWRRKWHPTPVFLPGESPWTEESGGLQSIGSQRSTVHGVTKSRTRLSDWTELKQRDTEHTGGISNFLEEISSLSHSVVFLYFFALITEESFLISPCYSLELCIQIGICFLFGYWTEELESDPAHVSSETSALSHHSASSFHAYPWCCAAFQLRKFRIKNFLKSEQWMKV